MNHEIETTLQAAKLSLKVLWNRPCSGNREEFLGHVTTSRYPKVLNWLGVAFMGVAVR